MKTLIGLLITVTLAVVIVILLDLSSIQPNEIPNGFMRTYIKSARYVCQKEIKQIASICGMSKNRVYVTTESVGQVLSFNKQGGLIDTIQFNLPRKVKYPITIVDSPFIYFFHGRRHELYWGNLNTSTYDSLIISGPIFTKAARMGAGKFMLRQFIDGIKDQTLTIFELNDTVIKNTCNQFELKFDNGLATEGKMAFDRCSGLMVYVYNRSNKIVLLDNNLNIKVEGTLIDTNTYPLYTKTIWNINKAGNDERGYIYNKAVAVDDKTLFVYSKLKADNESSEAFDHNCNIDMYEVPSLKYLGSFYLPKYSKEGIHSLYVQGKLLVAVYSGHIVYFNLPK